MKSSRSSRVKEVAWTMVGLDRVSGGPEDTMFSGDIVTGYLWAEELDKLFRWCMQLVPTTTHRVKRLDNIFQTSEKARFSSQRRLCGG